MAEEKKLHDHIELHALCGGGYVIRSGRFDMHEDGGNYAYSPRWEIAAFSTLAEATKWIGKNVTDREA